MPSENPTLTKEEMIPTKPVDGQVLKRLIEAGLIWLRSNQQLVNSLNVFPVPDGDTGTNMVLTMQAAYEEIANSREKNFGEMAHAVAHGALMGARGNSGVILSQLWRGFARSIDKQAVLDIPSLVIALAVARDTAYKGVVRPVEGTILTVAKDVAAKAEATQKNAVDLVALWKEIVEEADHSVQRTPDLLPVLKEAGVVDSGGKGLFFIFEGILRAITGQTLEMPAVPIQPLKDMVLENIKEITEPGQDYEVIVDFHPAKPLDLARFYYDLGEMGTSIQLGEGDGLYRLHIHVPTHNLYTPIDYTRSLGPISKVAIENLMEQIGSGQKNNQEVAYTLPPVEPGQNAVVAVVPGKGFAKVFASLGVAAIVEGGQTMNPSTQEIVKAFENLPTDKVILLPNNKNVILAANAAADLTVKRVAVIPSKSVPQGLAAMMRLIPDGDFDNVCEEMIEALKDVETGEITKATRSVEIDGIEVQEGQIIVLHNGHLVLSVSNLEEACLGFLKETRAEDHELITLFYGENVLDQEMADIELKIREKYPKQEVEIQKGGQPHYQFIISIE